MSAFASPTRSNVGGMSQRYVSGGPSVTAVEYLENAGSSGILLPSIETGISVAFRIRWFAPVGNRFAVIVGSKGGADSGVYTQPIPRYAIFDMCNEKERAGRTMSASAPAANEWHEGIFSGNVFTIDGVSCSPALKSSVYDSRTNVYSYLGLFCAWKESAQSMDEYFVGRIAAFQMWWDGEPVYDLVPVRSGNEGFMLDQTDGTLYGNAGGGNFLIGPDL